MVPESQLKDLLAVSSLTQRDRALLILGVKDPAPLPVKDIRAIGKAHGLKSANNFNASGFLSASKGLAASTPMGWELTTAGRDHVVVLLSTHGSKTAPVIVSTLRHHAATLPSPTIREFVREAVICFETKQLRAATVLSWVGAIAVLHDKVISLHLAAFNTEALKRDAKWKEAKTPDDLAKCKEHEFLQIINAIGVIGKDVKHELESCLKLRNSCGHPNSLKVGEHRIAGHIETLILNVYQNA